MVAVVRDSKKARLLQVFDCQAFEERSGEYVLCAARSALDPCIRIRKESEVIISIIEGGIEIIHVDAENCRVKYMF